MRGLGRAGEPAQSAGQLGFVAASGDGLGEAVEERGAFAGFAEQFRQHLAAALMQGGENRRVHPAHAEALAGVAGEQRERARVAALTEAEGELDLNAGTGLGSGGGEHRVKQRASFVAGEPAVGKLQRVDANWFLRPTKKRLQFSRLQSV